MSTPPNLALVVTMSYTAYGHGDGYCSGNTNHERTGTARLYITSDELSAKTGVAYVPCHFTRTSNLWKGNLCSFRADYECDFGGSGYCDEEVPDRPHEVVFRVTRIYWMRVLGTLERNYQVKSDIISLSGDLSREFSWKDLKVHQ